MYHLDRKIFLLEIKATTQYSLTFIFTMEITSCPTKSLAIERKHYLKNFKALQSSIIDNAFCYLNIGN